MTSESAGVLCLVSSTAEGGGLGSALCGQPTDPPTVPRFPAPGCQPASLSGLRPAGDLSVRPAVVAGARCRRVGGRRGVQTAQTARSKKAQRAADGCCRGRRRWAIAEPLRPLPGPGAGRPWGQGGRPNRFRDCRAAPTPPGSAPPPVPARRDPKITAQRHRRGRSPRAAPSTCLIGAGQNAGNQAPRGLLYGVPRAPPQQRLLATPRPRAPAPYRPPPGPSCCPPPAGAARRSGPAHVTAPGAGRGGASGRCGGGTLTAP